MKSFKKSIWMPVFLSLLLGITGNSLNGQVILKSVADVIDLTVQKGSIATLQIQEYRGTLQWQQSADGTAWLDWEGKTGDQVLFTANEDNFIRVAVSSENCDPVYSETVHVIVLTGPVVITSPVIRIAATEAYSGGQVTDDAGKTITGYGVCWSKEENPTTDDAMVLDEDELYTAEDFTSYISGLEPNTTYYARAFAITSGETAYGSQFSFTTEEASGTFIDERDQKEYKWIYIGPQKWMAENMAWLPEVSPPSDHSTTEKHYYVPGYEGSSVSEAMETDRFKVYGALYNGPASLASCPGGWHLPGDTEWKILEKYLGMMKSNLDGIGYRESGSVGGKLKEVGTEHWKSPNNGADNSSGFTALPGGFLGSNGTDFTFTYMNGDYAQFSGKPIPGQDGGGGGRIIVYTSAAIGRFPWPPEANEGASSVRCIKDAAEVNTPPTASLAIDPPGGTTETKFMLDASGCRDAGTNPDDLEFRWDFDGDGTWDTLYNQTPIVMHLFPEAGTYTVILEVIDSRGLTATATITIIIN